MQMVGLIGAGSSSAAAGSSKYKRALIVTGVIAAVLLVIVVTVVAILYVKVFTGTTGLQVSHASSCACFNGGTCVAVLNETLGVNVKACLCPDNYTGDLCELAFDTDTIGSINTATTSAGTTTPASTTSPAGTTINITATNTTLSIQPGVYWLQLVVTLPANTSTYTKLNGLSYPVAIYTTTTNYPADTLSTDTIQFVTSANPIAITSQNTPIATVNTAQYGASLIGFNLASVMATQVYFSVRKTSVQTIPKSYPGLAGLVTFDQIAATSAHLWDATRNAVTVTYTGAYFISLTIEVPFISDTYVMIMVNQMGRAMLSVTDYNMTSKWTVKNGIMSGRTACMLQLNANDVLTSSVYLMWSGTDLYSSPDGLSNMQAFLYSPQAAIGMPVAWSVASTVHIVGSQSSTDIVGYDLIEVNIGNAWNSSSNMTIIPVSGTYLIDVTTCFAEANTCGNGNPATQLMVNSQAVFTLKFQQPSVQILGCNSRSRSVIMLLDAGDTVYVAMPNVGGCLDSSFAPLEWFVGLRLY